MKIKGLILGVGVGDIVRNGNKLKAMAKRGHFKYPVDGTNNPYVDEGNNKRQFTYNGSEYTVKYFSGCFYPFVVKVS